MVPALVLFVLVLWLGTKALAKGGGWSAAFVLVGVLLSVPAFFLIVVLPFPLALFWLLLIPVGCRKALTTRRIRRIVIVAAVGGAFGVTGWMTWVDQRQLAYYRKE